MPDAGTALLSGGSSLLGGLLQSRSASKASKQQAGAAQLGIEEQQRQFDRLQELLAPYVQAGQPALQQQQAMLGLQGPEAQQQAMAALEQSPQFQALARQGEQAIMQNAAATGGLRGGNLQAALAQFRPAMLQQLIDQQYSRLGNMTTLGQNSAVGVGNAGMTSAGAVANLLNQRGAAQAGGTLGRMAPFVQMSQMPAQLAGFQLGRGGGGFGSMFGGTSGGVLPPAPVPISPFSP